MAFEVPGQQRKFDAKTVASVAPSEAGGWLVVLVKVTSCGASAACPCAGPKTLLRTFPRSFGSSLDKPSLLLFILVSASGREIHPVSILQDGRRRH